MLAEYVAVSRVLTNLDTCRNDISGDAAQQLATAVLNSTSLEVFSEVPLKQLRAAWSGQVRLQHCCL